MITSLPLLAVQRELLGDPRGPARFRRYLERMIDDSGELRLPLVAMNPMAKEHAAAALDVLLAAGADRRVAAAAGEADRRLGHPPETLRLALVLADDAAGGWTDRTLFDAMRRSDPLPEARRGFASALAWTSELAGGEVDPEALRREALRAAYRALHALRLGPPRDLRELLRAEGRAGRFAGVRPRLDEEGRARVRAALAPHLAATDPGTLATALFGDAATAHAGMRPLGVPPEGGLELGLADAWAEDLTPEAALGPPGAVR